MSDAVLHDRRILIADDAICNASECAHYLRMIEGYRFPQDRNLIRHSLAKTILYLKAAARSWNEMEALDNPESVTSEAAE